MKSYAVLLAPEFRLQSTLRYHPELSGTPEAKQWQKALLAYWTADHSKAKRHDGILYGCANMPVRGVRTSWMPNKTVHPDYQSQRNLDGTEIHFGELDALIKQIYRT